MLELGGIHDCWAPSPLIMLGGTASVGFRRVGELVTFISF